MFIIDAPAVRLSAFGREFLSEYYGCEVCMTHIPTPGDEAGLWRLGINLICDPRLATGNIFRG